MNTHWLLNASKKKHVLQTQPPRHSLVLICCRFVICACAHLQDEAFGRRLKHHCETLNYVFVCKCWLCSFTEYFIQAAFSPLPSGAAMVHPPLHLVSSAVQQSLFRGITGF